MYHEASFGKENAAVESKKSVKDVDVTHSVMDPDREGEVTVRYPCEATGGDDSCHYCAAPNETIKNVT